MLNSNDSSDDTRQEKLALLKYTYEQVLATQAEQIESKSNNTENIPEFGKILIKDGIKNNEIDLSLEYEYKNLTLYANNYFTQTEEEPFKYFNYSSHSTGHTFEVGAGYMLSEKFPLSVSWYTTFAGNDYRENGKRAWSSYCELSYPFSVKDVNMSVEAGFTPWESMYSDKFNVVNIGLSATKEIKITSNFSLPIFGKLIANPYEEQLYFVVGITL